MRWLARFPGFLRSRARSCLKAPDSRCLLPVRSTHRSEIGAGKRGNRSPVEIEKPAERASHRVRERPQLDRVELPPEEPPTALLEQRARAGEVAVGQVLVAYRHLDQPLQRLAVVAASVAPEGFEQLVHLEVEGGVEQYRSGIETLRARPDGGAGRSRGQRGAGPVRPLPQQVTVRELVLHQPIGRAGARPGDRRQLVARSGVRQRSEDERGEPVAGAKRHGGNHAVPDGAAGVSAVSAGGGAGGAAAGGRGTWSTPV